MATAFRTLLRNIQTGLYSDGQGGWAASHTDAHDYKSSMNAIKAAMEIGTENLYLVLKFNDDRLDVSHPLSNLNSGPPLGGKGPAIIITLLPFAITAVRHMKAG